MTSPTNQAFHLAPTRITTIDVLRGFALFGILYAHMIFWFSGGALPQRLYQEHTDIASVIAIGVYFIFILSKFFAVFSFLFGLSFYIQMQSLHKRGDNPILRFSWRLLILGCIGLVHHALWRADILSIYVPLGFLLIFARNLSNKVILVIGFFFVLNIPTKIYEALALLADDKPGFDSATMENDAARYYEIMKNASFIEMVIDNLKAMSIKFAYQITSGRLLITFGFFLLGMFVGRLRWFEQQEEIKPVVKRIWKTVAFALLATTGISILLGAMNLGLGLKLGDRPWAIWAAGFVWEFFNMGLTIFYISGISLLMYRHSWRGRLSPLADIGKMALTTYLMQTLFGLLLFYSFGFGLFAKTTPAINVLISVGVFALQIFFCRWWLSRFYYGPVEWLWRSMTYLKFQNLLKKHQADIAGNSEL